MQVNATVRYEKLQEIGMGQGMNSKVYLATDAQFSGSIAVKEIPIASFGNTVTDYYCEAERMFAASHPNVVPIHYAGEAADLICIAMPYFAKGSLAIRIDPAPLALAEVLRVGQGVLSGLTRVHNAGLLHFDVKPSNILFDNRNTPLLADFGQARRIGAGGVVQVPGMYWRAMPPETFQTAIGGVHSDIFQVGLLLYRTANGEAHYRNQVKQLTPLTTEKQIKSGKFPDRSASGFQPHIPQRLRTAIRKALRVNPSERYDSAIDFADELAKIPVFLDWSMTTLPGNVIEWRARRHSQPDLVVRMLPVADGKWNTEVYTDRAGVLRAKNYTDFWRKNLGSVEVNSHLTNVFEALWE